MDGNTLHLCFQYSFPDLTTYIGHFFVPLKHHSECFTGINLLNPHYESVGRVCYNHPHFTSEEAETDVRNLPEVACLVRVGLGYIYEPWFWDLFSGWLRDAVSRHTSYVVIWLQQRPGKQTPLAVMGQLRLQGGEHGRGRHQGIPFCRQHPAAVLSTHHLRELCNCHCGVLSLVLKALMVWIVLCGSYFHAVSKPVKVN